MNTNHSESYVYDQPKGRGKISALLLAGLGLFFINAVILACIWVSPRLQVSMYGEQGAEVQPAWKPSPFTEVVETATARKPRKALQVKPVIEPVITDFDLNLPVRSATPVAAASYELNVPRASVSQRPVQAVRREAEELNIPRSTAALLPARPAGSVHLDTIEVAPRRVTQGEQTVPGSIIN